MRADRGEDASSSVVEEPSHDDRKAHDRRKEDGKVGEEDSPAGAWPSTLSLRQEVLQVPEGPQYPEEQCAPQRPVARLHPRQREAPPAYFLTERPPREPDGNIVHGIAYKHDGGNSQETGNRTWLEDDPDHEHRRDAQEDEQIPLPAQAPNPDAAPQTPQARLPFNHANHCDGGHGRSESV